MLINDVMTNAIGVLAHRTGIVALTTHQAHPLVSLSNSGENIDIDFVGDCDILTIIENGVTRDDVALAASETHECLRTVLRVVISSSVNCLMFMIFSFRSTRSLSNRMALVYILISNYLENIINNFKL